MPRGLCCQCQYYRHYLASLSSPRRYQQPGFMPLLLPRATKIGSQYHHHYRLATILSLTTTHYSPTLSVPPLPPHDIHVVTAYTISWCPSRHHHFPIRFCRYHHQSCGVLSLLPPPLPVSLSLCGLSILWE